MATKWLLKSGTAAIFLLSAALFAAPAWPQQYPAPGTRWLEHLSRDLLPFWTTDAALGRPRGAFPSVRCNDGTLYDGRNPCPEIVRNGLTADRRHLVALSRQSYGYGVAFHLTGNRAHLDAMKAGIDFIRNNALDRINGGIATVQELSDDSWGPTPEQRNSQEMAYGLLGMSLYYYLTRDGEVLRDILAVKDHIFAKYQAPEGGLQWRPGLGDNATDDEKRLIAQLDQMNAYLVLLTPLLPVPIRTAWKDSLLQLANVMIERFYSPGQRLFAPQPGNNSDPATLAADFGINAKAFWMIRWTGLIAGRADLVAFAESNANALLKRAYMTDCGCWAQGIRPDGKLDPNKSWWRYAELDQLAATLALRDRKLAPMLSRSYDYWFRHFVDPVSGEVWSAVDGSTHAPVHRLPKQWAWKNAYHSFEHALVGYIVAQQLHAKPVTLYYAFPSDGMPRSVQPYFYSGTIAGVRQRNDGRGQRTQEVIFRNIH